MSDNLIKNKTIAILTTCADDWGGCEELWARSIPYLKNTGNYITVYKSNFNKKHPAIKRLMEGSIKLKELKPSLFFAKRIGRKLNFLFNRIRNPHYHIEANHYLIKNFYKQLVKDRPDLVLISQAINFDGLHFAFQCAKLNIPYIIVSQKAVEFYWPQIQDKTYMRETLEKALMCCFVSYHNLRLTEEQFGLRLTNSRVIFNPVKIKRQPLKYPATDQGFRLACVGRFFLIDKGQDILIRILAQSKWRKRPITVSLIGDGIDLVNIQEMINLFQLNNILIESHNENVESIWLNYHALILPSRSEGLPLTIIEAMAAGRTIITTNAGGNAEMIEDGITGFIGEANKYSLDEAMEKAWENRLKWESMGIKASEFIQKNIPESPEKNFAYLLNEFV